MINIEFALASFGCIEKPSVNIAMLKGPPPIPKNAEVIPNINPINKIATGCCN